MKKLTSLFTAIAILFCVASLSAQTTKTWVGTTTAWATSGNWSPSGVPASTDHVVFNGSGTAQPTLDANRTVANITLTGNTINLNSKVLTITGTTTLTGGTVNSGTINFTNTTTTFAGTTFGAKVLVNAANVNFNGSVFNSVVDATKTGSTGNSSTGGNTFNDSLKLKNTSTALLRMYYGGGNDSYNGHIVLSCTNTGSIHFGAARTPVKTGTLASGKTITIGSAGFTGGTLAFHYFTQTGSTAQSLTLTSSATLQLGDVVSGTSSTTTWNGNISFVAPNILIANSTFNSLTNITKTGSSSSTCYGNNTFNSIAIFNVTGSGYLTLANTTGDTYNGNVDYNLTSSANIYPANNGTNNFYGSVRITTNNLNVTFNNGTGTSIFTGSSSQSLTKTGTGVITIGRLTMNKASNHLTISSNVSIPTAFTLTSGKIIATHITDTICVSSPSMPVGSSSSYVDGVVSYKMNGSSVNQTFPIGNNDIYQPLSISNTGGMSGDYKFAARYFAHTQTSGLNADTSVTNLSTCENWKLNQISGTAVALNVTLGWKSTSCNGAKPVNMRVARWNGAQWVNAGNGASSGNNTAGTVRTASGQSTLGYFTTSNKTCTYSATITPSGSTTACSGVLTLSANSSKYYKWSSNEIVQVITPTTTGTCSVAVRDTNGCKGVANQLVTIYPAPITDARDITILTSSTSKIGGYPTVTSGTSPFTYSWSPSTSLDSTNVANPTTSTTTQRNYFLQVTDSHGCIARDTVNVAVISGIEIDPDSIYEGSEAIFNVAYSAANKSMLYFKFPDGDVNNTCSGYNFAIPDSIGKGGNFSAFFRCIPRLPGTYAVELYCDLGQTFPHLVTTQNFTIHALPSHLKPVDHIFKPNGFVVGMFDFNYRRNPGLSAAFNNISHPVDFLASPNPLQGAFNTSDLNILSRDGFNVLTHYNILGYYSQAEPSEAEVRSITNLFQKNKIKLMPECGWSFYVPESFTGSRDCWVPQHNIPECSATELGTNGDNDPHGQNTYENGIDISDEGHNGDDWWLGYKARAHLSLDFDMTFNPLISIPGNSSYVDLKKSIWGYKMSEEPNYWHPQHYSHAGWEHIPDCCNLQTFSSNFTIMTEVPPSNLLSAANYMKTKATGTNQKMLHMFAYHYQRMTNTTNDDGQGVYDLPDYFGIMNRFDYDNMDVILEGSYGTPDWTGPWEFQDYNGMLNASNSHYLARFKNITFLQNYANDVHSVVAVKYEQDIPSSSYGFDRDNYNSDPSIDNGNWLWFLTYNSIIHGGKGLWYWKGDQMYNPHSSSEMRNRAIRMGNNTFYFEGNTYDTNASIADQNNRFSEAFFPSIYKYHLKYLTNELKYLMNTNLLSDDNGTVVAQKLDTSDPYCIVPSSTEYTRDDTPEYSEHSTENYGLTYTIRTNGNEVIMIIANPLPFARLPVILDFSHIPNKLIQKSKGVDILFETSYTEDISSIDNYLGSHYRVERVSVNDAIGSSYYKAFGSGKTLTLYFGPLDVHVLRFIPDENASSEPDHNNGWINTWSNYGSGKLGTFGKIEDNTRLIVGDFTGDSRQEVICTNTNGSGSPQVMLSYDDVTNSGSYNFESVWDDRVHGAIPLISNSGNKVFVGNFYGDSHDEICVVDGADITLYYNSSGIWTELASTAGLLTYLVDYSVLLLDYDSDGKMEIVEIIGPAFGNKIIKVFKLNTSNYEFEEDWYTLNSNTFNADWTHLGTDEVYTSGDVDGDGKINELVCYRTGSSNLAVLKFNISNHTWTTVTTSTSISISASDRLLVSNIDTDDKDELTVIDRNTSTGYATTYDLNTGTGTLSQHWTNGNSPSYIDNWNVIMPNGSATTNYFTIRNYVNSGRKDLVALRKSGCSWNAEMFYISNFANNYRVAKDVPKSFDFNLYPNPTDNSVYLDMSLSTADGYFISIIDITGRIIRTEKTINTKHQLDLSNLQSGVYFVNIKTNGYISITKRLVVVK